VKRIFNAIEDKRRKELLNDTINDGIIYDLNVLYISMFIKLMNALKEASVDLKEIAYMLLRVENKRIAIDMIGLISTEHGDKYVADILLSIDDDDDLRSMIINLKDKPELIARILCKVDDAGRFIRLFNIVSSDISEQNMEIVLAKIKINDNIVNEFINKLEDEQNAILGGINNIQPVVVDEIKCATKNAEDQARVKDQAKRKRKQETEGEGETKRNEKKRKKTENTNKASQIVQLSQQAHLPESICEESLRNVFDEWGNILGNNNPHKILNSSNRVELEKYKAYMQELICMLKMQELVCMLKMLDYFNRSYGLHDVHPSYLPGVFEKREKIIEIIETIKRKVPGMRECMNEQLCEMICDMILDPRKIDDYRTKCLYGLINMMIGILSKAKDLKREDTKVYYEVVMFCNKIKEKVWIYFMEKIRIWSAANINIHKIDETVVWYNEFFKKSKDKNISGPRKSADEMENEMTPDEWNIIICAFVESICKQLISRDYELSNEGEENFKEAIRELPYFGWIISNCESNPLISGTQKRISMMMLALLMVLSIYSGTISQQIQKIEDNKKPIPAREFIVELIEIDD